MFRLKDGRRRKLLKNRIIIGERNNQKQAVAPDEEQAF